MKILKFNIAANSSTGKVLTVSQPVTNSVVSQYDIVKIVAYLDVATLYPSSDTACTVIMRMLAGSASQPTSISDYDISLLSHMIPDPTEKGVFYFYLNQTLGNKMTVGDLNRIYYNFQVYRNSDLCSQQVGSDNFGIYKTNISLHYQPDDFTNLFVAVNTLEVKINAIIQ